jgi:hypothetical protein
MHNKFIRSRYLTEVWKAVFILSLPADCFTLRTFSNFTASDRRCGITARKVTIRLIAKGHIGTPEWEYVLGIIRQTMSDIAINSAGKMGANVWTCNASTTSSFRWSELHNWWHNFGWSRYHHLFVSMGKDGRRRLQYIPSKEKWRELDLTGLK